MQSEMWKWRKIGKMPGLNEARWMEWNVGVSVALYDSSRQATRDGKFNRREKVKIVQNF